MNNFIEWTYLNPISEKEFLLRNNTLKLEVRFVLRNVNSKKIDFAIFNMEGGISELGDLVSVERSIEKMKYLTTIQLLQIHEATLKRKHEAEVKALKKKIKKNEAIIDILSVYGAHYEQTALC